MKKAIESYLAARCEIKRLKIISKNIDKLHKLERELQVQKQLVTRLIEDYYRIYRRDRKGERADE